MHAEIAARRQRRCAHLWRIEWLAGLFDESVKPSLRQQFLQAIVEHVSRRARHLSPCHEEVALKLTFTPHRHRCYPFRIFNLHTESGKPNFVTGLLWSGPTSVLSQTFESSVGANMIHSRDEEEATANRAPAQGARRA